MTRIIVVVVLPAFFYGRGQREMTTKLDL